MNRDLLLNRARARSDAWDLLVIGGGATGIGIAVDAAARGYEVLLLERDDFGKGTSSRATKLVHGSVRYLEGGNLSLVRETLRERGLLQRNAPHLVHELPLVVPSYSAWEGPFYDVGLIVYQWLAGKSSFGPSRRLSRAETLRRLPTVDPERLAGGVVYFDGQFDDTRLLINLVATAVGQGAVVLNYANVAGLTRGSDGIVHGVTWEDVETGERAKACARVVVNATGAYADGERPRPEPEERGLIEPSQGAHVVLDRSFLPGEDAILVPHAPGGRVMFALPWHGHTLVGTTDEPAPGPRREPVAMDQEIDLILETAARYLARKPTRADVLSTFAGVRPLAKCGEGTATARLVRDHTRQVDNGLLTVAGGKWTTYRRMAEDAVDHAARLGGLPDRPCRTSALNIHACHAYPSRFGVLAGYGADAIGIQALIDHEPALARTLDSALPYVEAEVTWAVRCELARSVEDILARRLRALFLNARAAVRMAPRVAELMARELGRDSSWRAMQLREFEQVAEGFLVKAA